MSITVDIQNRYEQFRRTNSTAAFIPNDCGHDGCHCKQLNGQNTNYCVNCTLMQFAQKTDR